MNSYETLPTLLLTIDKSELGTKIYNLFNDCINFTPKQIISDRMKDIIIKSFAIASIPGINQKDINYIRNELIIAGWFVEPGK